MSQAVNTAVGVLGVIPAIIEFARWAIAKGKARRAARRAGKRLPVDPAAIRHAAETVRDLTNEIHDVVTPPQTPRGKRGLR